MRGLSVIALLMAQPFRAHLRRRNRGELCMGFVPWFGIGRHRVEVG